MGCYLYSGTEVDEYSDLASIYAISGIPWRFMRRRYDAFTYSHVYLYIVLRVAVHHREIDRRMCCVCVHSRGWKNGCGTKRGTYRDVATRSRRRTYLHYWLPSWLTLALASTLTISRQRTRRSTWLILFLVTYPQPSSINSLV